MLLKPSMSYSALRLFHHDRFGKMAWAVDIATAKDGYVIRQQLQRYHFQDRLQQQRHVWDSQHAGSDLLNFPIRLGYDREHGDFTFDEFADVENAAAITQC